MCATTRSADLQPYASEYEGYMGNYGNTMDRWYRRAALVVWPRDRAVSLRDEVVGFGRQQGDEVTACVMPALRAAGTLPADTRRDGGFDDLATDCAARLQTWLARPPRADDDWSIELPDGCACELCSTLSTFLRDPARRTFEWPLAQERRRHVHSRIDAAELPVRHETRRKGRPYTLVLTKSQALFELERQARIRDETDLEWLTGEWKLGQ